MRNRRRYIVREDASTYHTYYIDVNSGEPRFGNTIRAIATPPAGPAASMGHLRFPAQLSLYR